MLPANKFGVGDIVLLEIPNTGTKSKQEDDDSASKLKINSTKTEKNEGIVSKISDNEVVVAFNEWPDDVLQSSNVFVLHLLANNITYNKLIEGLNNLVKNYKSTSNHLVDVIFGNADPTFQSQNVDQNDNNQNFPLKTFNSNLNQPQIAAISFALAANDISMIHGPPGTGKTTVVVEIILQLLNKG